ncbi:30S ribosome-binding factor RbfA [Candidatus Parcubacteria bacterium]|nr:MAG: 30S ribosome-binding factor RbfA [Candidatus Parcubacteria bacterium]
MSKRTEQVAELLRSTINQIIIKDFEAPKGTLVSVSEVTVAPDLKNATALVSIIPNNKIGSALEAIKKFTGHVQRELGSHISIKITPRINFELDERDLKYKAIDEALKN